MCISMGGFQAKMADSMHATNFALSQNCTKQIFFSIPFLSTKGEISDISRLVEQETPDILPPQKTIIRHIWQEFLDISEEHPRENQITSREKKQ
mgnify:CR=1 FL=1